jgi:hypothetical protein
VPVGRLVAIVQFESPVHTTYGWEPPGLVRFVVWLMCWQLARDRPLGLGCGGV